MGGRSFSDDKDACLDEGAIHPGAPAPIGTVSSALPLSLSQRITARSGDPFRLVSLLCAPLLAVVDRYATEPLVTSVLSIFAPPAPDEHLYRACLNAALDKDTTWSSLANELIIQLRGQASTAPLAPVTHAVLTLETPGSPDLPPAMQLVSGLDKSSPAAVHLAARIDCEGAISLALSYPAGHIKPSVADGLLRRYENLLKNSLETPGQRAGLAPILSEDEYHTTIHRWNDTATPPGPERSITEIIERQVPLHGADVALCFRNVRLTYSTLNRRANQLAHHLRRNGVRAGTPVGIYMDRDPDIVVAILAVWKAGGAYVPLDASYPRERLTWILQDVDSPVVITHARHQANIPKTRAVVIELDSSATVLEREAPDNPERLTQPRDLAFVLFTSGSTGRPKGVMVTHSNLINYFTAWQRHCNLQENISAICQMAHFSFAVFQGDVIRALCAGKRLVLCPQDALFSPGRLFQLMRSERTDFAEFVPTLLRNLYLYASSTGNSLEFIRILVVGADRWYTREHRQLADYCPDTRVIHVYGSSETTLDSTFFEHTSFPLPDFQLAPIGRPIANVRAYIVDRNLQPLPVGVTGELLIGGAGVAAGYWNRDELTSEKFLQDPFLPEADGRIFRTGDMASFLPDGNIAFHGRRDLQVKIRGFRIDLGEIEQALGRYPPIKEIIAQPVSTAQGEYQLVAYFVTHHGQDTRLDWLKNHCRRLLPEFMVPTHLIQMDSLPLTPSGKIDRKALPDPWQTAAIPDHCATGESDTGQLVMEICCHALGKARIDPDDEFAALGCDSLAIVTMLTGIESAFGIAVDETNVGPQIFKTVNTLTAFVERQVGNAP